MQRDILLKENTVVTYDLQYKKVKNINLRIKPDGSMHVSAGRRVSQKTIEAFLIAKADFILDALQKCESRPTAPPTPHFSEEALRAYITDLCQKAYPYYEGRGIIYPEIKFRRMVSRWGSCHPVKGILTFSTNLIYAPAACIEYVVWHEFTHFLQANHSAAFYDELEKVCPDWKACRAELKEISLR